MVEKRTGVFAPEQKEELKPMSSASPPPVTSASIGAPAPGSRGDVKHDPSHQARLLRDALQSDKARLGCFLGAGCPLGIYDKDGKESLKWIPDVAGLTAEVRTRLTKSDEGKADGKKLGGCWDSLGSACADGGVMQPTVEHVLSELRTRFALRGKAAMDGMDKARLASLDETVCDCIVAVVGKQLPDHWCAYHRLAAWTGRLQRSAPVELFTPNYDLLLEEAFERQRLPLFDGFVGAREPFFDLASIEHDAIPGRWSRIWKLHGSINWQRRPDGTVFRARGPADAGKAMIYPSHLKYDQSRRMPYLAMLDRLKAFFRAGSHAPGSGPPVLVVCGYSFSDEHLNEVLLDGLRGNRSAQCFVLAYSSLANSRAVVDLAARQPNLTVLASDGAVVGTRKGLYCHSAAAVDSDHSWIYKEMVSEVAGTPPQEHSRLRLGDFHFFGLFLEHLYGGLPHDAHHATHS